MTAPPKAPRALRVAFVARVMREHAASLAGLPPLGSAAMAELRERTQDVAKGAELAAWRLHPEPPR